VANIVLFHSVYGLRPGVTEAADRLRSHGHTVTTPDLYDGKVFDHLDEARQFHEARGMDPLMQRAWTAVQNLPADLVYSGLSLGCVPAEEILMHRPGGRAALLFAGAVPPDEAGMWPSGVPAEVHYATSDPFVEQSELDGLRAAVTGSGGTFTAFAYPDSGHLFIDPGLTGYNRHAAELMWQRVAEFLAQF
jgi:dienelactone hydrolase